MTRERTHLGRSCCRTNVPLLVEGRLLISDPQVALQGHDRRRHCHGDPGNEPSGADAGAGASFVLKASKASASCLPTDFRRQLRHADGAGGDPDRNSHPRPRPQTRRLLCQAQAQGWAISPPPRQPVTLRMKGDVVQEVAIAADQRRPSGVAAAPRPRRPARQSHERCFDRGGCRLAMSICDPVATSAATSSTGRHGRRK